MADNNAAQISGEIQDQLSGTPNSPEAPADTPISPQIPEQIDQILPASEETEGAALAQLQNLHLENGPPQISQMQLPTGDNSAAAEVKRAPDASKSSPQKRPRSPSTPASFSDEEIPPPPPDSSDDEPDIGKMLSTLRAWPDPIQEMEGETHASIQSLRGRNYHGSKYRHNPNYNKVRVQCPKSDNWRRYHRPARIIWRTQVRSAVDFSFADIKKLINTARSMTFLHALMRKVLWTKRVKYIVFCLTRACQNLWTNQFLLMQILMYAHPHPYASQPIYNIQELFGCEHIVVEKDTEGNMAAFWKWPTADGVIKILCNEQMCCPPSAAVTKFGDKSITIDTPSGGLSQAQRQNLMQAEAIIAQNEQAKRALEDELDRVTLPHLQELDTQIAEAEAEAESEAASASF